MSALRGTVLAVASALPFVVLTCGRPSTGKEAARDPELEARVAELMPRIEQLSGLKAKRAPAVRRASAGSLESYLRERLDAEYPGDTLERLAEAYRAFGLIPDTIDVRALLVDLLLEQAIGYYDPVQDILFVRQEAPSAMEDAVIVHELVHALQDQYTDLDSLAHSVTGNDARSAMQAAVEGHATVVMFAHAYGGAGGSRAIPELGPEMAGAMADPSQFPRLAGAPAIVREPLLFAYLGGARYVQRLWKRQAERPAPFGEWLPESTEQLIHTERLLDQRDTPTPLVIAEPTEGWEVVSAWDLGELEMRIFLEEHLGDRQRATEAAAGWDGDAYALLARAGERALVWYSVWDSEADAAEFADAYRLAFRARFGGKAGGAVLVGAGRQARVERLSLAGMAGVRIVETPAGVELAAAPEARLKRRGR